MRVYLFICFCIACSDCIAQSTIGITNVPDTSYTTYSAFLSTRKTFPDISIVQELKSDSVAEKRNISYCRIGTRSLIVDAFYPNYKFRKARTALIIIHGGGWRSGNRSQHYPLAQHLARLGYVCFTPEYRLSTEALYPAAVYDVKASIRWVRAHAKEFNIDTNKIAIAGFSAGGELAAFMGATNGLTEFEGNDCETNHSSQVNAIIDIDGTLSFVHPESGEADDSKKISASTYWFGYSKKDNPTLLERASPLTHVGPQTPATLFINSSVGRMHAGREDFIRILKSWQTYTEVKTFENSPHSFCLFEPWFEPTVGSINEFLLKVLVNK